MKNFIFLFLINTNILANYDGPKSPGIETLETGVYQIKGKIDCKTEEECFLRVYNETSREYKLALTGDNLKNFVGLEGYLTITGTVKNKGLASGIKFYVNPFYLKTTDFMALKSTVTKLK